MNFFKKHSYDIVKLFINQLGLAIFSMALYSAVAIALPADFPHAPTIRLVISIISTLFYFSLIYMVVWEFGAKDHIKIEGGRMKRSPFKGFFLQLFANIPNFILILISLVCFGIYALNGNEGFKLAFSAIHAFIVFIESMYTGIIISIVPVTDSSTVAIVDNSYLIRTVIYAIAPILSVLAAHLGYAFGERDFKITSIFTGKQSK